MIIKIDLNQNDILTLLILAADGDPDKFKERGKAMIHRAREISDSVAKNPDSRIELRVRV